MILFTRNSEIPDEGWRGGSKMHVGSEQVAIVMRTACESKEASNRSVTYRLGERMSLVLGPL